MRASAGGATTEASGRSAVGHMLGQLLTRAERVLTRPLNWAFAIAAVLALQASLIFTHRPWLDEWQALQIALQSADLYHLLENLRYEGHPPLWYLLLRATATVVPTFHVLSVVAALLAAVVQLVLLTRSPLPRLLRLTLSLNMFVLFEYLTISRSMTLGVACAVVSISLRRSRWRWVAIALLPLCDFLFGVISALLVALDARERALWWPGVAGWLVCGAVAAWSVVPAPDMVQALTLTDLPTDLSQHIDRLGLLLVPWQTIDNLPEWNGWLPFGFGVVAGPLFVWFALRQVRHDRFDLGAMAALLLLTTIFSVTVYPLQTRHLSLVALFLVLLKWRDADAGRAPDHAFSAWLIVGALCGLGVAAINLSRPFDTGHQAAAYIERHGLRSKHWLVWPESRAQGISALLGIEFERMERDCSITFVRWNHQATLAGWSDLDRELRRIVRLRGRSYLLSDQPLELPRDIALPVAFFPAGYNGYAYHITLIGPSETERRAGVPSCIPNKRPLVQGQPE